MYKNAKNTRKNVRQDFFFSSIDHFLKMAMSLSVLFLLQLSEHFTGHTRWSPALRRQVGEQQLVFPRRGQGQGLA